MSPRSARLRGREFLAGRFSVDADAASTLDE
jgi:hypothetical protein